MIEFAVYCSPRDERNYMIFGEILSQYFSVKKGLFHYWHMASTNYREYLKGDEVRVKKYFYVLRPLLAAKWIIDKKIAPPMLFDDLVEAELEDDLKPEMIRLLEVKKNMSEMRLAPKIQVFNDYIERIMLGIKDIAEGMEENKVEWEPLNELFLRIVGVGRNLVLQDGESRMR